MVVTRRAAGVPAPPTSRSNSSQELARANKGKTAVRSPLANDGISTSSSAGEVNGVSHSASEPTGPQFSDDAIFSVSCNHLRLDVSSSHAHPYRTVHLKSQGISKNLSTSLRKL